MKSYKSIYEVPNELSQYIPDFLDFDWEVFETKKKGTYDDSNYTDKVIFYLGHEKKNADVPMSYLDAVKKLSSGPAGY